MICRVKIFLLLLALISTATFAQKMSREEAIHAALKNNDRLMAEELHLEQARQLKKAQVDIGKFSATLMKGQYNTIQQDNNLTLTQNIPFPSTLVAQSKLGKEQIVGAERNLALARNNLVYEVKTAYELLLYYRALHQLLLGQDSLFTDFARAAAVRYKTGEGTLLEKTTAESQLLEIKNQLQQNETDITITQMRLQVLIKSTKLIDATEPFTRRTLPTGSLTNNPTLQYELQQTIISRQMLRVERNKFLPDLELGYFNQTLIGFQNTAGTEEFYDKNKRFQGFMVGVAFPLWFAPQAARTKAAYYQQQAAQKKVAYTQALINQEYEQALQELKKNEISLAFYEQSALQNAVLILSQALKSFRAGEIGYIEYLQSLRTATGIKLNYLVALQQHNLTIIKIESLTASY
ncbi:MAG: TolC family protein [Cyclobacteriaceae bacterium]|nr:TolC family protein [Cyclobacteriaceae bacterium]